MKKDKSKIKEAVLEGILEIILTAVCFGIGALIFSLLGIKIDSPNIDFETIVLLGIIAPVLLFAIINGVVQWVKKITHRKKQDE